MYNFVDKYWITWQASWKRQFRF